MQFYNLKHITIRLNRMGFFDQAEIKEENNNIKRPSWWQLIHYLSNNKYYFIICFIIISCSYYKTIHLH